MLFNHVGEIVPLMNHWLPSEVKNLEPLVEIVGMAAAKLAARPRAPATAGRRIMGEVLSLLWFVQCSTRRLDGGRLIKASKQMLETRLSEKVN